MAWKADEQVRARLLGDLYESVLAPERVSDTNLIQMSEAKMGWQRFGERPEAVMQDIYNDSMSG